MPDERKKITVRMEIELWKELAKRAVEKNLTRQDFIIEIIEKELKGQNGKG